MNNRPMKIRCHDDQIKAEVADLIETFFNLAKEDEKDIKDLSAWEISHAVVNLVMAELRK